MDHFPVTKTSRIEGRREPRIAARIEVHLRKADDSTIGEILTSENMSSCGARLMAGGRWKPGEAILLKALKLNLIACGRIAYCHKLENGKFEVGVDLASSLGDLPK
jgi:hypothetical protein